MLYQMSYYPFFKNGCKDTQKKRYGENYFSYLCHTTI